MKTVIRCLPLLVAAWFSFAMASQADAQYPIAISNPAVVVPVQPVSPAVVGYTAERRGLLGLRTVYRPVVTAPLAVPVAPAIPVAPAYAARPVLVAPNSVMAAKPVVIVPPPVTTYRVPVVPVAPMQTYRIPVTPVLTW